MYPCIISIFHAINLDPESRMFIASESINSVESVEPAGLESSEQQPSPRSLMQVNSYTWGQTYLPTGAQSSDADPPQLVDADSDPTNISRNITFQMISVDFSKM